MNPISKFIETIKKAPDKKRYVDLLTAVLTIPVLLTVIVTNTLSLQNAKKNEDPKVIALVSPTPTNDPTSTSSPAPSDGPCKKGIGDIEISYPQEGQIVKEDPVEIEISYESNGYCTVVWSYRINNGAWSSYSNSSPSLYSMSSGTIQFQLRVKSTVSQDQKTYERTFIYQNPHDQPTLKPEPSQTSTPSASL